MLFSPKSASFSGPQGRGYTLDPCDESGKGPKQRRKAKIDREQPPADSAQLHPITPAEMCAWKARGEKAPRHGRHDSEQRWYSLTGRVVAKVALA